MEIIAFAVAVVAAIFAGRVTYRVLFEDADDFWECVRFSFTPDLFSLFRGEYFRDVTKSFRFGLFMMVTIGSGVLVYHGLAGLG